MIDLIRARAARRSRAPHQDGASIALVVEGGAMRGVISAGMVWALEDLGLADAFDAIYGSSAGAINAAYFLAGQAGIGSRIYYEDINNARFIDISRALAGRPIVNLGYLLDEVAVRRKPLNVARVLSSASPFAVMATDVETRESCALRAFETGSDLFGALRASATMPVVAGPPPAFRGRRYLDASLSEPIPVPTAERDGHTHVLALLTRESAMRPHPSAFDRYFVGPRLRRLSGSLADQYMTRAEPYAELLRHLDGGRGPMNRAVVEVIRVVGCHISKLERGRRILENGARKGYDAVMAAFGT